MGNGSSTRRREGGTAQEDGISQSASIFTIFNTRHTNESNSIHVPHSANQQVQFLSFQRLEDICRSNSNFERERSHNSETSTTNDHRHSDFPLLNIVANETTDSDNNKENTKNDDMNHNELIVKECTERQLSKSSSFESLDSAFSDKSMNSSSSHNSHRIGLEEMIDLHRPLLEDNLNVTEILPHLSCILERRDILRINKTATYRPAEAVADMIKVIKACKEKGKWQLFMEALIRTEYTKIAKILKGEHDPFKDENQTKLLGLFHLPLIDDVYVPDVAEILYIKNVINKVDYETIEMEYKTQNQHLASFSLLLKVSSRHPNWYQLFIETLCECNMGYIVKDIEDHPDEPVTLKPGKSETKSRELPPLPPTPYIPDQHERSIYPKHSTNNADGRTCNGSETSLNQIPVDSNDSLEMYQLRNQIVRKTDELNKLRARYFVLEAEEEIYETIPCNEENNPHSGAILNSPSDQQVPSDNFSNIHNVEGHIPDLAEDQQAIQLDSFLDQGNSIGMLTTILSDCVRSAVASEMHHLKDELKQHVTKEIQSSKFDIESQQYSSNSKYRGIHFGVSPVKIFDASYAAHDPYRQYWMEYINGHEMMMGLQNNK